MSDTVTRQASLPPVPDSIDAALRPFLQGVFENLNVLMGHQGDPMDGAARFRDLTRLGVAAAATDAGAAIGADVIPGDLIQTYVPLTSDQLGRPPVAGNPVAVGGFDQVVVTWAAPSSFAWLGFTEVWCSNDALLSHAVLVGTAAGTIFVHKLGGDEHIKFYWIKFISRYRADGAPDGAFSATPASAQIAVDVPHLISLLSHAYASAHPDVPAVDQPLLFIVRPVVTVGAESGEMVDLGDGTPVFVPSGVYIQRASIARATITTAQIKELSADKITTGTIAAGETITVGGAIRGGKDHYADLVPGWWIGDDSGTYKLVIGDSTNFMRWDGDKLEVRGDTAHFDNIQGEHTYFTEMDTPLGHGTVFYGDNLVVSGNAGALLVPSDAALPLAFDHVDRKKLLCLQGDLRNEMPMVFTTGTALSALLTPDFKAYNGMDSATVRRARKPTLALRLFIPWHFAGTVSIKDQYGGVKFSASIYALSATAYSNDMEQDVITHAPGTVSALDVAFIRNLIVSVTNSVRLDNTSTPGGFSAIGTTHLPGGGTLAVTPRIMRVPAAVAGWFGGYVFTYEEALPYANGESFYMETVAGIGVSTNTGFFQIIARNGSPFANEDSDGGIPYLT